MYGHDPVRVSTEYTYRGVSATVLENRHLRLTILDGKGGDIVEFRDRKTDINVFWESKHNWQAPSNPYLAADKDSAWETHYPGGWQVNLPIAGWGGTVSDVEYGLHGESALLPWEIEVLEDTDDVVRLRLWTALTRYPFSAERHIELEAGARSVRIEDTIQNEGDVELEYIWQQHLALGPPLIGPGARLDVPAERGYVEESYNENDTFEHARLAAGEEFEWPQAPTADGGIVDLTQFPPYDSRIHDQVYATGLPEGWYAVTNPEIDLGFGLSFPVDPFECLWYWQPFGGIEASPYFGRNYNVGLEPTTAHPAGSIPDAQRSNGSMKSLSPGESVEASLNATLYHGRDRVDSISDVEGTANGASRL